MTSEHSATRIGFSRQISVFRELITDPSCEIKLKEFSYIDYRNCRCGDAINCLFWMLHEHVGKCGDPEKELSLVFEYAAGLIETAQPIHTIKLLTAVKEKMQMKETSETQTLDEIMTRRKGICLSLLGDAHMALGNYPQAKKLYGEAVKLQSDLRRKRSSKSECFFMKMENLSFRIKDRCADYAIDKATGKSAKTKLELAAYLTRISTALLIDDKEKIVRMTTLKSLRLGFENVGSFLLKAQIYLSAVRVFRVLRKMEFIRRIEKPMLSVIETKSYWNDVDEVLLVAHVFLEIYQIRALKGRFAEAIEIGSKALVICDRLNISWIKLVILPTFIEIMVWTKHINEAVDLMKELYFLADEDIDKSAITWYYALSLEFLLDAGMVVESYETCYNYFRSLSVWNSKICVSRDPESLMRLMTCICIWQLRIENIIIKYRAVTVEEIFIPNIESRIRSIKYDRFSEIFNGCKVLECSLLILLRRINLKKSNDLVDRLLNIEATIRTLDRLSNTAGFIKPHLYLLASYMDIIRGRKYISQVSIQKSQKLSLAQGNEMISATIMQNQRTWKEACYNNMAHYWIEYIGASTSTYWQDIHGFNLEVWSTILYPFPLPDSYL